MSRTLTLEQQMQHILEKYGDEEHGFIEPKYEVVELGVIACEQGDFPIIVKQVENIDPALARQVFDEGTVVSADWGWKKKIWFNVPADRLALVQAAARFFYGWEEGSEEIEQDKHGTFTYKAYYAC